MKEFLWAWLFWTSTIFCTLLASSLMIAYWLYSTAPLNPHTQVFAAGFGFALGFFGLGAVTIFAFDRFSQKNLVFIEVENELFNRVIRELPFFFFSVVYFFALSVYMGIFMLVLSYIQNSFV